jgi:hypothetical protein
MVCGSGILDSLTSKRPPGKDGREFSGPYEGRWICRVTQLEMTRVHGTGENVVGNVAGPQCHTAATGDSSW